jgi:hypothetical protein
MTADSFRYSDEQWRRMEAIVERAGKAVARDKFNAQRAAFEKMAGGWKGRIPKWNGRNFGHDDTDLYKHVEEAARELKDALTNLNFPAIFIGNELVWKSLADTRENEERFTSFCKALDHVNAKAAFMSKSGRRRQVRLARDRFFLDLRRVWTVDLDLDIKATATSRFVSFVKAASEEVHPSYVTADMISKVIRNWPRS